MRRIARKMTCLLLAVLLCASMLVCTISAEENMENSTVDFVLVMDCSGSLGRTDPNYLCATACKMFMDMVPLEGARVAVIAFGYPDNSSYYALNGRTIENPLDLKKVHIVSELDSASQLREKNELKQTIDTAARKEGDKTPIGTALLSAVDLLEKEKSSARNACIILLTDGEVTADQSYITDIANATTAAKIAGENEWPIYTIQLNNNHVNDNKVVHGQKVGDFMKNIAITSGAGEEAHNELTSFAEGDTQVANTFLKIFDRFMFDVPTNVETLTANETGVVERKIDVPALVSEATIIVTGKNLQAVDVVNPDGTERKVSESIDEKNIVVTTESDSYYCIKLLCPAEGTWAIRAHGDPNARISMYDCCMKELSLVLKHTWSDPSKTLSKNDVVTFRSYFAYHGTEILKNSYYQQKQPTLIVTNVDTGISKTFEMKSDADGYVLELPMNELGEGTLDFRAMLKDDMFRDGEKYSDPIPHLTLKNKPITITKNELPSMKGFVNTNTEPIDITKYIDNPDGDQLECKIVCETDRNVVFTTEVDRNGYLTIRCGMTPGEFQVTLMVKDCDMKDYESFKPFTITVKDRGFNFRAPSDITVCTDAYPWQKDVPREATVDFAEYYSDPDGVEPIISNIAFEGKDVSYTAEFKGSQLHIVPITNGEGAVKFTVSDGVTTEEESVRIRVISGKTLFWEKYWIYFAIGAAVALVIVLIIVLISKNTRVKGVWDIIAEIGGGMAKAETVNFSTLSVSKKKKFPFYKMMDEIALYMSGDDSVSNNITSYFMSDECKKLELRGVLASSGFWICNIPSTESTTIEVLCNGVPATKKVKISGGSEVTLTINPGVEMDLGALTLTIRTPADDYLS